jgi:hypothetical protein
MFRGLIEVDQIFFLFLFISILTLLAQVIARLYHHTTSHFLITITTTLTNQFCQLTKVRIFHCKSL